MAIDLERIKAALSCRDVAERLGIHVPPRGDAECPKHRGKSLRIKDDYFKCWGGCAEQGGQGDVIAFYQWITGADFRAAVEGLGRWAGVPVEWKPDDVQRIERRRRSEDILMVAAQFYEARYAGSPAEAYAVQRRIAMTEARLGYAPDAWDSLVGHLSERGIDLEQAAEAGLVKERDGGRGYYDRLRHRLVIPFIQSGRCLYLQGRALPNGHTDDGSRKYINTALSEPPLYAVNGALRAAAPIVTESTSDVLRLSVAGLPAIGTAGAEVKEHQLARLKRLETLYVATHNDAAGVAFADALASALGERVRIAPPPEPYKDWDEALNSGAEWQADEGLTWPRWKMRRLASDTDEVLLRKQLQPILSYLAGLDNEAATATYLDELRRRFGWRRDVHQAYAKQVRELRAARISAARDETADVEAESEELGETEEPPIFLSPALAEHDGVVYVSQRMAFKSTRKAQKRGASPITTTVWKPIILSSDRRRIVPKAPPAGADPDSVWWLDESKRLALVGGLFDAPDRRWSYQSIVAFLNGASPTIAAHEVYDALMASLRRYVYHAEQSSYVVDVLWAMGTYFYRLWNAYPYLALHGEKGAGKTTLLTWLWAVCFNAEFVVNTSEASLYRSIQAKAPTLLIDEQEGLNSSKAAKETKADLMGLLKSGYKAGAKVARQRLDRPELTEYFDVYSPKALAAIELFEDVLENRAILTFMTHKPSDVRLDDDGSIIARERVEFGPLRDSLYLLLMQEAQNITRITARAQFEGDNRFRELFRPLYAMAALVDMSRGQGRDTIEALQEAAGAKAKLRAERDYLTPEMMLREALMHLVADAWDDASNLTRATRRADGMIVCDTLQIKEAFEMLFSDRAQSFFNDTWLGKQAQKVAGMTIPEPRRRRRDIREFDPITREAITVEKRVTCYVLDPKHFGGE